MIKLLLLNLKQVFFYRGVFLNQALLSFTCIFAIAMSSNIDEIAPAAKIILIVFPMILISLQSDNFFRRDFESGALDFLIVAYPQYQIFYAKIIPAILSSVIIVLLNIMLGLFSLKLDFAAAKEIFAASIPLIINTNLVVLIISAANIYLEDKTNLVSIVALPFILPNLILYGLFFHLKQVNLIYIACGINLILLPIAFYLVRYLLMELYNS